MGVRREAPPARSASSGSSSYGAISAFLGSRKLDVFELVGVYDDDYVSWDARLSGARIAHF
ncbi:hypothetical protein LX36DRAFT_717490 [Colletotrichum falcatum]|nr:hypothetical protein LX36DRAFT_717490 [Colletotrichum falcatum]